MFRKQNDKNFKFPYQGMGDNSINDKFYDLSDKSLNLNIKRFYIPQKIETLKTTLLLKELIKDLLINLKK